MAILPATGRFSDMLAFAVNASAASGDAATHFYVVTWDSSGQAGHSYDLLATEEQSDEVEPNGSCAEAQVVAALPANLQNLSLSSLSDEDWFAIEVTVADVGKPLNLTTTPGDVNTDTVLEVLGPDCTTSFGKSSDADYHEALSTAPLTTAGTYYVVVTNSDWGHVGAFYNLTISFPM
jgi:hypothetical protein